MGFPVLDVVRDCKIIWFVGGTKSTCELCIYYGWSTGRLQLYSFFVTYAQART